MVIECAFGNSNIRTMDIDLEYLPSVISSCFVLHNFCEIHKEPISSEEVKTAISYDGEFQPDYLQCHSSKTDMEKQ